MNSNANNTDNMNTESNQARIVAGGVRTSPISDEARPSSSNSSQRWPCPKPKIGCSHFSSDVYNIRHSSYTILDAIADIWDNVKDQYSSNLIITRDPDGYVTKLQFCDADVNGFEGIENEGVNSPLCMGHVSPNHKDDEYSSQFGRGLKDSSIYLGGKLTVITKISRDTGETVYIQAELDFGIMQAREDPMESRELTDYKEITVDEYKELHTDVCGYDCGSSVIIEPIRREHNSFPDDDAIEKRIKDNYHEKIKADKEFKLNHKLIEPKEDVFDNGICAERTITREIRLDISTTKIIQNVYCKETTRDGETKSIYYKPSTGRIVNWPKDKIPEYESSFDLIPEKNRLIMKSTNSVHTPVSHIMGNNSIEYIRCGRSHGAGITDPTKDGYGNNITNILSWESKDLNEILGISSTKGMISKKENLCISFLEKLILLRNRNSGKNDKYSSLNSKHFKPAPAPAPAPASAAPPAPAAPPASAASAAAPASAASAAAPASAASAAPPVPAPVPAPAEPDTPSEEPASDEHTLLAAAQALASINSNEGTHDDALPEPEEYDQLSDDDKKVVLYMRNNKHLLKFIT